MAVPLAALQLRPSPFDPVGVLQTATNLQGAQTQNELGQLRMAELQEQMRESRDRRGALQGFRDAGGMTNPAALTHLAGHPETFTAVQAGMTAQQTAARTANARAAYRVMAFPEGSRERASAWQEELNNARREGRMPPEAYERYAAYQQPPQLLLESIVRQGQTIPTPAEMQDQAFDRQMMERFGFRAPAAPAAGPAAPPGPPGAPRVTVNTEAAPQFQGLLRDLDASGVRVDPTQTGSYNPRNIAGTNRPSLHASGRAVDVNWRDNPEGSLPLPPRGNEPFDPNNLVDAAGDRPGQTEIPAELARALAARNGLRWGGDFRGRSPDPMHFEVAGAPPVSGRALTTVAGVPPPAAAPAAGPPSASAAPRSAAEAINALPEEQQLAALGLARKKDWAGLAKLLNEAEGSGKAPTGFEWVDPRDKSKGLRAIRGGPAEQLAGEMAGRMAFLDTGMARMPTIRQAFERPWGVGDHFKQQMSGALSPSHEIPALSGEIGQARRDVRMIIEAALRALTGAAAPEPEVERYSTLFTPGPTDSIESAKAKLDALAEFAQRYRAIALAGRSSDPASLTVTPPARAPQAAPPAGGGNYRVLGVR